MGSSWSPIKGLSVAFLHAVVPQLHSEPCLCRCPLRSGTCPSVQAQAAAKRALALLDAPHSPEGAFAALFLNRQSRCASFDAFWRVSLPLPADALDGGADQPEYRYCISGADVAPQQHVPQCNRRRCTFPRLMDWHPD